MTPSGTELKVLQVIKKLGKASPTTISRKLMITSGYVEYLCRYLVRENYLEFARKNCYRLTLEGKKLPSLMDRSQSSAWKDKEMIKEVAIEIARQLKVTDFGDYRERRGKKAKIKTDFVEPIGLDDVKMETNIDQISATEEKSPDFETTLKLFKDLKLKEKGSNNGRNRL